MKCLRKVLGLVLTGAMLFSLCAVGFAAEQSEPVPEGMVTSAPPGGGMTPPDGMGGDMTPPDGMGDGASVPDGMGGGSAESQPAGLTDTAGHWAEAEIDAVVNEYKLMNAENGKFEPDTALTRGDLLQLLYEMEGKPAAAKATFTDVAPDAPYADAVGWAEQVGICKGSGDGKCNPEAALSLQDMLTFFARYCEVKGVELETAKGFDAAAAGKVSMKNASRYAKASAELLVNAGLAPLHGESFDLNSAATRGEAAVLLYRFKTCGAKYDIILNGDELHLDGNVNVGRVELTNGATVSADVPVVVFFEESDTVESGLQMGNVQFVSEYDEVIAIVHTNDVHGHIEVEPYVKGLADQLKASGDYSLVLTISAGDIYGGGEAVAGSYDGELIPAIMDKVYDITVPGNNDFGSSGVVAQNLLLTALYEHTVTLCDNTAAVAAGIPLGDRAASYTAVCGNELFASLYNGVTLREDGTLDLSALKLENVAGGVNPYQSTITYTTENGTVVGLYGITTSGGACSVEVDCDSSIVSAQRCVEALQAEGADVIVAVCHTGWMGEGSTETSSNDTNSWQLCNQVDGQDAFIDSHTHSIINNGDGYLLNDTFINQAQSVGGCIGVMYLYVKDGKVIARDGELVTDMSGITPDAEVQALVDTANAKVAEDFGKAIGHTEYFLNGERLSAANEGGSVRANETNLGDLMTDIIRAAASEKNGVEYDFCVYPGYWLRSSVEAGDITLENIQAVFANPTVLHPVEYTAEDVVSMVTKGLSSVYPEKEDTTFNHYSGIAVTYTNNGGKGAPVTIHVGDTLVYDANNGGVQVAADWTCSGIFTLTGGEIDNYTGSTDHWLCHDKTEVQTLVSEYLASHTAGVDYVIHPNTVAPDNRIVEIDG